MPKEVELKLALPVSAMRHLARHPLLAGLRPRGERLTNAYFDTDTQTLREHRVAVRIRHQGRRWLQTVKQGGSAQGGLSARPEWEYPFTGALDFSPVDDARLRRLLTRLQDSDRLRPVFETNFRRRTWSLAGPSGGTVLLMADEGEIIAGTRRATICELELELDGGAVADLFALARTLAQTLPLKPEILSKAERGYRLASGELPPPVLSVAADVHRKLAPQQAFTAIAHACVTQLQGNEAGALDSDDPEYVHQMRVALRRLHAATRTFRPALPPAALDALRPGLRAMGRALGAVRDLDVLLEDVVAPALQAPAMDPALLSLVGDLIVARDAARERIRHYLYSAEYGHTLLLLGETLALLEREPLLPPPAHAQEQAKPAQPPADDGAAPSPPAAPAATLGAFAAGRLRRLHRQVRRLGQASASLRAEDLHALRIGVKRLRYALEAFAPLFDPHATRRMLKQLARMQSRLGYLNDLAVAGPVLLATAGDDPARINAVSWIAGHHGAAYARTRAGLPAMLERLQAIHPPWRHGRTKK